MLSSKTLKNSGALENVGSEVHNFKFKNDKTFLTGLREFLAAESSLKMMKNNFHLTSKAHFVFKIFKFLS